MVISLNNGQPIYISKVEDLKELVEPEVYDAIEYFYKHGETQQIQDKCDEFEEENEYLERENSRLENVNDDLEYDVQNLERNYSNTYESIGNLINELKSKELKEEVIIQKLEEIYDDIGDVL